MAKQLTFYTLNSQQNKIAITTNKIFLEYTTGHIVEFTIFNSKLNIAASASIYQKANDSCGAIDMRPFASNGLILMLKYWRNSQQSPEPLPNRIYILNENNSKKYFEIQKFYVKYSEQESLAVEITQIKNQSPELSLRSFNGTEFDGPDQGGKSTNIIAILHGSNSISIDIITPEDKRDKFENISK